MKNYRKYTNFIPESYIKSIQGKNNNNDIKVIRLLLLIAVMLIPTSVNKLVDSRIDRKQELIVEDKKEELDKTDLLQKWIDLKGFEYSDIQITDKNGIIKLKGIKDIKSIEENREIKINTVKQENSEYIVEVNIKWIIIKNTYC